MLDKLNERIKSYLQAHQTCVVSINGVACNWAMPVSYRSDGLKLECIVPVWADLAYYLEQEPEVLLIIQDGLTAGTWRWVQYCGKACSVGAVDAPFNPALSTFSLDLYKVFKISPRRIDLIDESQGWGRRETLELS